MNTLPKTLAYLKYRFDVGIAFLVFANFTLLIITASDKINKIIKIPSDYSTWIILLILVPLAFIGTMLFGHILLKIKFQDNLASESSKRNPQLMEILQKVNQLTKTPNNPTPIKVCVSGYFNPPHKGHIQLFQEAKKLGTHLTVILNNDNQVKIKGSTPFMNEQERKTIIENLKPVDQVIISIDQDKTVCKTLEQIKPDIFANGGDRTFDNIPEVTICKKINCKMIFGIGGNKIQSSSWLLNKIKNEQ